MAATIAAEEVSDGLTRCPWGGDELSRSYHDLEWGVPQHDDKVLFEFLILEGAQAGLSWNTILRKRANYRAAFAGFDPEKVARFDSRRIDRLMTNPGIVRNRMKIESAVTNARAFQAVRREFRTVDRYIWEFVGGAPKQNAFKKMRDLPAETPESRAMSKDLRKRGFTFVGSTICYAFMQAVGIVNDHLVDCFRYSQLS